LLLLLQPTTKAIKDSPGLPFKAYEPTIEIRDRKTRSVYVEAPYIVETGEAERIAVDWTARGGEGGSTGVFIFSNSVDHWILSCVLVLSHLQTQRAAVKMLHDRIQLLVSYVASVIEGKLTFVRLLLVLISDAGTTPKDHGALRSLSALLASLPASDQPEFREEFDTVCTTFSTSALL